jgi:hypothetical protein
MKSLARWRVKLKVWRFISLKMKKHTIILKKLLNKTESMVRMFIDDLREKQTIGLGKWGRVIHLMNLSQATFPRGSLVAFCGKE